MAAPRGVDKRQQLEDANRRQQQDSAARGRTEEALRESERRFRAFFDDAPIGKAMTAPDGSLLRVNRALADMLGYTAEELVSISFAAVTHPDDVAESHEYIRSLLAGERRVASFEKRYVAKGGHIVWAAVTSSLYRDAQERPQFLLTHIQDITERKQAETILREKDQRLGKLASQVPGMLYQFMRRPDGAYCVPFTSDAIREIFGCSPEEVRADFAPIARVILPEDRAAVIASIERSGADLTPWQCEYRVQLPGGGIRWLWGQALPERLPDGSILWHGFNADVTERKQAEGELAFRNILLSTQQEVSIDGILVVDEQDKILSYNRRFVEMWGIPLELVERHVDGPVLQCVADQQADPEQFLRRVRHLYEHKRETSREELVLKDGRVVDRYSSPMFGPSDRYYGRVWSFRDITDRKQAERASKEQLDELRRWHEVTLGREGRVLELKKEINELLAHSGQPPRYPSATDKN